MLPDLKQRRQLLSMAIDHQKGLGKKFKDGTLHDAIAASIWARSLNEMIEMLSLSMDKNEIPDGIEMPWGKTVKVRATHA